MEQKENVDELIKVVNDILLKKEWSFTSEERLKLVEIKQVLIKYRAALLTEAEETSGNVNSPYLLEFGTRIAQMLLEIFLKGGGEGYL